MLVLRALGLVACVACACHSVLVQYLLQGRRFNGCGQSGPIYANHAMPCE